MAFDDDDDNSSKFVILRKDNADITGQIRRMNNSFHDYNEVSYCFGMFRRIKKTQKEFIDRGGDDDIQDNQFLYNSQNQNDNSGFPQPSKLGQVRKVSKPNRSNRSLDITG